jgi:hypothetical protein
MSLYPSALVCPACDLLVEGAWAEHVRCKCNDAKVVPLIPRAQVEAARAYERLVADKPQPVTPDKRRPHLWA